MEFIEVGQYAPRKPAARYRNEALKARCAIAEAIDVFCATPEDLIPHEYRSGDLCRFNHVWLMGQLTIAL